MRRRATQPSPAPIKKKPTKKQKRSKTKWYHSHTSAASAAGRFELRGTIKNARREQTEKINAVFKNMGY